MKLSLQLILLTSLTSTLSALQYVPAQAQESYGAQAADANVTTVETAADPETQKKRKRQEEQAKADKIHDMEKTVAKDSTKENRLALVDYLESLGAKSEKDNDWPGVWRYYQRAAMVLRDPKESDWEARAAADDDKSSTYRLKETDRFYREQVLKELAKQLRNGGGISVPSLNLPQKSDMAPLKESRYREVLWKRLHSDWTNSKARSSISDQGGFKKPVTIAFDVHSDGEISDITLVGSSGDIRIDQAAMKVLEDVGKLEPLEPGMGSIVHFQIDFPK